MRPVNGQADRIRKVSPNDWAKSSRTGFPCPIGSDIRCGRTEKVITAENSAGSNQW